MQPHLAIIALSINDCQDSVPPDRFSRVMAFLIQNIRAGRPNCSILLVANANPTQGMTTTFRNAANYQPYVDALAQVAQANSCGFVNFHAKWSDPLAQGFVTADQPHPNPTGHSDMANTLIPLVQPAAGSGAKRPSVASPAAYDWQPGLPPGFEVDQATER